MSDPKYKLPKQQSLKYNESKSNSAKKRSRQIGS